MNSSYILEPPVSTPAQHDGVEESYSQFPPHSPHLRCMLLDIVDILDGASEEGLLQDSLDDGSTSWNDSSPYISCGDYLDTFPSNDRLTSERLHSSEPYESQYDHADNSAPVDEEKIGAHQISEGSLECVKAINETIQGTYRLSYRPPLLQSPLMFWTESDFGLIKEFVRLVPASFTHINKLQMAEAPESSNEKYLELVEEVRKSLAILSSASTGSRFSGDETASEGKNPNVVNCVKILFPKECVRNIHQPESNPQTNVPYATSPTRAPPGFCTPPTLLHPNLAFETRPSFHDPGFQMQGAGFTPSSPSPSSMNMMFVPESGQSYHRRTKAQSKHRNVPSVCMSGGYQNPLQTTNSVPSESAQVPLYLEKASKAGPSLRLKSSRPKKASEASDISNVLQNFRTPSRTGSGTQISPIRHLRPPIQVGLDKKDLIALERSSRPLLTEDNKELQGCEQEDFFHWIQIFMQRWNLDAKQCFWWVLCLALSLTIVLLYLQCPMKTNKTSGSCEEQ